ncbi:N(4)-(beta-N-acetylglucosaminyl)-L-asparaginase [Flaviaesturariibacter amylovorans]|uniref:N(4)-(Beta-N-acetylglucosaminyl)-L-asparaginase n=1 Tax=Flaviaesturariibacter amylovorans TaxID=1084520 RepID=A0ABP8GU92_9BACT
MLDRRHFLNHSLLGSLALLFRQTSWASNGSGAGAVTPLVISTWEQNVRANAAAWEVLSRSGTVLDAVEAGVQVAENDPKDQSVGYGGLPDRDGKVTLDACIMDGAGNCGSVMFLEGIRNPIKVARLVMEKSPHVQLVGAGALQFALANGFTQENLLTAEAEKEWQKWLRKSEYDPMTIPKLLESKQLDRSPGQAGNHDTIGMIALDRKGNIGGACSTSGMAFKMRGRVGDSPIIGGGLYVDSEVGAATCSGVGEEIVRICGTHTIVEYMRQGYSPEDACRKTIERLVRKRGDKVKGLQVGFIAVDRQGRYGAFALRKGFTYAVHSAKGSRTFKAKSLYA